MSFHFIFIPAFCLCICEALKPVTFFASNLFFPSQLNYQIEGMVQVVIQVLVWRVDPAFL